MHAQETVDYHIRSVWAAMSRMYNAKASEYNGTMSIGYVLLNIDKEGTPSTSLGPKMGMESTSLSRTLKRMEDQGLITRKRDENDGRMVRILLTDRGKDLRSLAKLTILDFNEEVREHLSADDLKNFFHVMETISGILEKQKNLRSAA